MLQKERNKLIQVRLSIFPVFICVITGVVIWNILQEAWLHFFELTVSFGVRSWGVKKQHIAFVSSGSAIIY